MNKAKLALVATITLMFVAYLALSVGPPVCISNGDCHSYIALMHLRGAAYADLLKAMAWPMPSDPKLWGGPVLRPWAVPLVYSLFGEYSVATGARIVIAQTVVLFLSWLFFAYACSTFIRAKALRIVAFSVIAGMMFGQGYWRLNTLMMSDSLAMSSVLVQLALCLLFASVEDWSRSRPRRKLVFAAYCVVVAIVSAFEMATRDANITLAFAGMALLFLRRRRFSLAKLVTLAVVCALAVPALGTARQRHLFNDQNLMLTVILPSPEMRAFFVKQGMPVQIARLGEGLKAQDIGNADYTEIERARAKLGPLIGPLIPAVDPLYTKYLVTHPLGVARTVFRYRDLIFDQQLQSPAPWEPSSIDRLLLWLYTLPPALYLAFPSARRQVGLWPLVLFVAGAGNAVMGFYGDAWEHVEMARHAFIGSVVMRLGSAACLLFLIDNALVAKGLSSIHKR